MVFFSLVLSVSCIGIVIRPDIDHLSICYFFSRLSKLLQSWFNGKGRPKYWRYDVIAGIVSGFSTSIIAVFVVRILSNAKSWFPRACCSVKSKLSKVNLLVQVKRACLVIAYFYILGWMATQYLKILFPKA